MKKIHTIRAEVFIRRFAPFAWVENHLTSRSRDLRIPRRLRRNKGDETRLQHLKRTTYADALRRGLLIKILFLLSLFGFPVFSDEPKYTVKSSEERIGILVTFIEKNLEGTSVLDSFKEEQRLWEAYKKAHLETLFPETINSVKMLWGSCVAYKIGEEVLILNTERIKLLESYITKGCGTDGLGEFKEYVEELKRIQKKIEPLDGDTSNADEDS